MTGTQSTPSWQGHAHQWFLNAAVVGVLMSLLCLGPVALLLYLNTTYQVTIKTRDITITAAGSEISEITATLPYTATPSPTTVVPTSTFMPTTIVTAVVIAQPPNPDGAQYHVVLSGETMEGIAFAYGVSSQIFFAKI